MSSQSWTPEETQGAIDQVVEKAARDADFRRKAISDAAAAVLEVTGRALPDDFELRFIDGAIADRIVVLPAPEVSDELGDVDLEPAAGGVGFAVDGVLKVIKMPGPPAPFVPSPLPNIAISPLRRK